MVIINYQTSAAVLNLYLRLFFWGGGSTNSPKNTDLEELGDGGHVAGARTLPGVWHVFPNLADAFPMGGEKESERLRGRGERE